MKDLESIQSHEHFPTTLVLHSDTIQTNKINIIIISFYGNNSDFLITLKICKLSSIKLTSIMIINNMTHSITVTLNGTYPCFFLAIRIHKYQMCSSKVQCSY